GRKRITITSPYLVLDEPMMIALTMASDRGVEVNLVVPILADHPLVAGAGRAVFDDLVSAGVRSRLFQRAMLHATSITGREPFASRGSTNLEVGSFYLNCELNVLLFGPEVTGALASVQAAYMAPSKPVDLQSSRKRSTFDQYRDRAAALLSALL